MATINESIDISVPLRTAYNQWTQFEDFPEFMENIEDVQQLDDKRVHWRARVWGKELEWDSEITRQVPDKLIEWRSIDGPDNGGFVEFREVAPNQTRVTVHIDYDPRGVTENVGSALGVAKHRVQEELENLKEFLEHRGTETGAWRGSIDNNKGAPR